MPVQSKKSPSSSSPSEKAKPRKKKKKETFKRSSGKSTHISSPLSEGHRGLEPRARSQSSAADRLSDSSVHARSSTTQNNPSANCWSSSEARSTSVSSAENVIASSSRGSSDGADRLNGQQSPSTRTPRQNESIRWSPECDDSEEEVERIRVYKQNRRKRYMAYLHERTGGESSPQKSFYA